MKKSKTKNREKPSSTTGGAADTVERNKQGLVDDELLTNAQLADAEAKARQTRQSLGRILVSSRYASEEQLARFIAKKTHLPYINLNEDQSNLLSYRTLVGDHRSAVQNQSYRTAVSEFQRQRMDRNGREGPLR